jgi:hypothetical protein
MKQPIWQHPGERFIRTAIEMCNIRLIKMTRTFERFIECKSLFVFSPLVRSLSHPLRKVAAKGNTSVLFGPGPHHGRCEWSGHSVIHSGKLRQKETRPYCLVLCHIMAAARLFPAEDATGHNLLLTCVFYRQTLQEKVSLNGNAA